MKILQYDEPTISAMTANDLDAYKADPNNYSIVPFRPKLDPGKAWAMPFVTGKRYKIHWKEGLDFERMRIDLSEKWSFND